MRLKRLLRNSRWNWNLIIYLPTFSESNSWDFRLVMTQISENIPATSKYFLDFPKTSELWRICTKMFRHALSTSTTIFTLCNSVRTWYKRSTLTTFFGTLSVKLKWIFFRPYCESGVVFSPQAWVSPIIGVMNGPLKFLTARKILPLLDLLAKFKRVLACSCSPNFCVARKLAKQIFYYDFCSCSQKYSQCSACSWMLAKTIRHPS